MKQNPIGGLGAWAPDLEFEPSAADGAARLISGAVGAFEGFADREDGDDPSDAGC